MSSTTRIPKAEITGLYGYLLKRVSRKLLGDVPEPAEVMWHNRAVLTSTYGFGRKIQKWDQLDPNLKSFAHMAGDELFARLLEQLGAPAMVELTASVAFANLTTRCNTALGIEAQGFSKACTVPLAQPPAGCATRAPIWSASSPGRR